jgi:hypothetical protein
LAIVCAALALGAGQAFADGEVTVRGAYYKERSTRVQQPMVDARFDVGTSGELAAYFLVDSITSASVAAGMDGAPFTETRYEQGASYLQRLGDFRVGGGYRISDEPDYQSGFVNLRGEADLAQKNTTLGARLAQGWDSIGNQNGTGIGERLKQELGTTLVSLSVTQVLSRVVVVGITYDASYLSGYLGNPYRTVIVGGDKQREQVPDSRLRHAVFGSVRGFVVPTRTTLWGGYRFYRDDWGIQAHAPEVRITQEIVPRLDLRLRYRYYRQTSADFAQEVYDRPQAFVTDDPKLAGFSGHSLGAQLGSDLSVLGIGGTMARARIEALFEYVTQTSRFGNAVVGQFALTVPMEY